MEHVRPSTPRNAPSITVITPAYNAARYLAEAVASVLGQTFSNLELLIVDDGSTDDTLTVAKRLAATDRRVRVIATPNGGPAAARNAALRCARGEFIAFLDSDDLMMPDYLARQAAVFDAHPDAAIVTPNAVNRGGGATFDGKPFWPQIQGLHRITVMDLLQHEDAITIMSMFRRRIVDVIGPFNTAFTGNEDYEFWLRAAIAGFVIIRNCEPLAIYRRRDASLSSNEPRMIRGLLNVFRDVHPKLGERPREQAALNRQISRFARELPRAELRATLQRSDAAGAAHALRALALDRGSWTLAACARLTERWPQPLIWAYRLRRGVRAA